MAQTQIEWATHVWNPVTGCSPVSEGCQNCYARRMATRLRGRCGYPENEPFRVTLRPERLEEPLRWKRPKRVFVCSMGDLFYPDVPSKYIQSILKTIFYTAGRLNKGHVYIILTKRPERMRDEIITFIKNKSRFYHLTKISGLWLGVTAENQQAADERIPVLLQTPAAVRFVSCEPLLGPVDLELYLPYTSSRYKEDWHRNGYHVLRLSKSITQGTLDWVICSGETGPGARPMHPDWVRSLRDQCQAAGVPFFFKQWGEFKPMPLSCRDDGLITSTEFEGCKYTFHKVGKKKAGRLLDGRTWDEFPGKG